MFKIQVIILLLLLIIIYLYYYYYYYYFSYMDSSFCFISAHLSAGQNQVDDRIKNYKVIKKQFNKSLNIKQSE